MFYNPYMFECLEWHVDEDVRNIIYDSMGFNSIFLSYICSQVLSFEI